MARTNNLGNRKKYPVKRRTDVEVKADVDKAVLEVISKYGFANITMNSVANAAQVSPASVISRYGSLEELISLQVKNYDFWLNEIISKHYEEFKNGKHEEFLKNLLKGIAKNLDEDPVLQELLIWEVQDVNEMTKKAATLREAHTAMYNDYYQGLFGKLDVSFSAFTAILIAGIYYLILHKDTSTFCGIDLNTRKGMKTLMEGIDGMASLFFDQIRPGKQMIEAAKKMKENGINIDIISDCTGLTTEQITDLN